ncbi:MAG: hypothetical protein IT269_07145 [Saprospiraceae bacterium]|nr:hypothetical protein [Saprospiraceae bacterium]
MTGENRLLTHFGLHRLTHSPRLGLWALIQQANRPKPLNINDLVFGLGPLINAAGRLGDAREAVRLLLSTDKTHAQHQANLLARHNAQRRNLDQQAFKTAQQQFESLPDYQDRKSIVLFNADWHKGIIGIIASRMSEAYNKPAIILTLSNGRAVGSARSIRGFDLYTALGACQRHFITFGGHAHAAGVQLLPENLTKLINDFEAVSQAMTLADMENPVLEIASKITLEQITPEFWQQLKRFEPFGPSNRNPVFWAENVENTGKTRILNNNHVRFSLRQNKHAGIWAGIGFNLGHQYLDLSDSSFDIAFSIAEEEWQGKRGLTLLIKGVRAAKK